MANGGPDEIKLDETAISKSKFNIVDMVTGSTHCLLLSGQLGHHLSLIYLSIALL